MTQEFCSDSRRIIGRIVILRKLWYNEEAGQKNKSGWDKSLFPRPLYREVTKLKKTII